VHFTFVQLVPSSIPRASVHSVLVSSWHVFDAGEQQATGWHVPLTQAPDAQSASCVQKCPFGQSLRFPTHCSWELQCGDWPVGHDWQESFRTQHLPSSPAPHGAPTGCTVLSTQLVLLRHCAEAGEFPNKTTVRTASPNTRPLPTKARRGMLSLPPCRRKSTQSPYQTMRTKVNRPLSLFGSASCSSPTPTRTCTRSVSAGATGRAAV